MSNPEEPIMRGKPEKKQRVPLLDRSLLSSSHPDVLHHARSLLVSYYERRTTQLGKQIIEKGGNASALIDLMEVAAEHANNRYLQIPASQGDQLVAAETNDQEERMKLMALQSKILEGKTEPDLPHLLQRLVVGIRSYCAFTESPDDKLAEVADDPTLGGIPTIEK